MYVCMASLGETASCIDTILVSGHHGERSCDPLHSDGQPSVSRGWSASFQTEAMIDKGVRFYFCEII